MVKINNNHNKGPKMFKKFKIASFAIASLASFDALAASDTAFTIENSTPGSSSSVVVDALVSGDGTFGQLTALSAGIDSFKTFATNNNGDGSAVAVDFPLPGMTNLTAPVRGKVYLELGSTPQTSVDLTVPALIGGSVIDFYINIGAAPVGDYNLVVTDAGDGGVTDLADLLKYSGKISIVNVYSQIKPTVTPGNGVKYTFKKATTGMLVKSAM